MNVIVDEIRNTQPNHSDKCELVIKNPCFDNRFYSVNFNFLILNDYSTYHITLSQIDSLSLNSFKDEYDNETNENENVSNSKNENMFMKRFDVLNQSNHSIATLKATDLDNENFQKSKKLAPLHSACYNGAVEQVKKLIGIFSNTFYCK